MRIAIRTDAGKQIGYGHLRRCMTLADALRARGADVQFVDSDDSVAADAGIADTYTLDEAWFSAMRARATLLVIDDLADRALDADLVTNSAITAPQLDYRTPADCRLLLGPTFALVRAAFCEAAHAPRRSVERVLVTLGGSDPTFRTRVVVAGLQAVLASSVHIDVVLGPLHGDDAALDELASRDVRVTLHRAPDLPALVAAADVAVSGGGQTTFELAAAGVPAVALALADNQRLVLAGFAQAGTLVHAGDASAPDVADALSSCVMQVVGDEAMRRRMSEAGRQLVDGRGAERVAAALLERIRQ
jgi:UDP-2,4-diacetamido-2,4,6-trideoxy-beta-L-altropyranose hydrolase